MNTGLEQLVRLPPAERLELIEALWDSLGDSPDELPVPDWQKKELERREAAHQLDPNSGVTWEEAKARILKGRR